MNESKNESTDLAADPWAALGFQQIETLSPDPFAYERDTPTFGYDIARKIVDLGYAIFPQNIYDDYKGPNRKRAPAYVDGVSVKPSDYYTRLPTDAELRSWSPLKVNIALILGTASNNVFALDIDIDDKVLCEKVANLADQILGVSPLRRQGRYPRISLLYRAPEGDLPDNRSYAFENNEHAVEVLAERKMITMVGRHHGTGDFFKYQPAPGQPHRFFHETPPSDLPLVSKAQFEEFLTALDEMEPLKKRAKLTKIVFDGQKHDNIQTSMLMEGDWTEDPQTGLIVDGRENFLWVLCKTTVQRNAGYSQDVEGIKEICAAVLAEFNHRAKIDGKWTFGLQNQIWDKVSRAARLLADGVIKPYDTLPQRKIIPTSGKQAKKSRAFSWLRQRRAELLVEFSIPDAAAAQVRALKTDRADSAAQVSAGIGAAFSDALDDVYARRDTAHLIKSPTGAGKTSKVINGIADDLRTYQEFADEDGAGIGPFVFMLPSYNNIGEVRQRCDILNLDPQLNDDELAAAAADLGIYDLKEAQKQLKFLRRNAKRAGLKHMTYMGKIAAGCLVAGRVSRLMESNIGTSGMCKASVFDKHAGEMVDVHCEHYFKCPAIAQRAKIKENHIVFLPRNFLDLSIPEELKRVRAVIADETIFNLLVHTTKFPLATLDRPRAEPKPTKAEEELGVTGLDLLEFREHVVGVVMDAFRLGQCPAEALKDYEWKRPKVTHTGLDLATYAKRVCGAEVVSQSRIRPDLTDYELEEICNTAQGEHIRAEHRFWSIVCDRIKSLQSETVHGAREMRIQLLGSDTETPDIRVSWLSEPNWEGLPMILLDASGNANLLGRVLNGREVEEHNIDVDLNLSVMVVNDRRFAMHNLVPGINATPVAKMTAARTLNEIRKVISTICGVYAHGRILFGMPLKLRRAICKGWTPPPNADFGHFGAMAGLDFAREHLGVVSFGRMELPTEEIDGQVAALTYRDKTPEQPIDVTGCGVDEDGKTVYPNVVDRILKMRDGSNGRYEAQEHAGPIARQVQQQHREENVRQLVGRVRPVYREDTPFAIIIGQAVPEDLIVDEVATWDDLVHSGSNMWEAVRRAGVINAYAMVAAAPDIAPLEKYEAWIDSLSDEILARYHRCEVTLEGVDDVQVVYVPGEHRFMQGSCISALKRLGMRGMRGTYHQELEEECAIRRPAADDRPTDQVEEHLGSLDKRYEDEQVLIGEIRDVIQCRGEWKPGQSIYRAGTGEIASSSASIGVWAALKVLDDPWVHYGRSEKVEQPVEEKTPTEIEQVVLEQPHPDDVSEFLQAMGM